MSAVVYHGKAVPSPKTDQVCAELASRFPAGSQVWVVSYSDANGWRVLPSTSSGQISVYPAENVLVGCGTFAYRPTNVFASRAEAEAGAVALIDTAIARLQSEISGLMDARSRFADEQSVEAMCVA